MAKWRTEIIEVCEGTRYSIERDLFIRDDSSPRVLPRPLSISLRVGLYCNLACPICLSDSGSDKTYAPFTFVTLLKALSRLAPLRLVWTGGEPLLYPLQSDLERSMELGFFNVVTTNLTLEDSISRFAGQVFYNASIYGWDEYSYLEATGRDYFNRVDRNLHRLFEAGHLVGANIRVDAHWHRYLPALLDYVREFPFRKLLVMNTLPVGRIPHGVHALSQGMCSEVEAFLGLSGLPFPVILPYVSTLSPYSHKGYISVEGAVQREGAFLVNGVLCSSAMKATREIERNSRDNFRLFTLQKYCNMA